MSPEIRRGEEPELSYKFSVFYVDKCIECKKPVVDSLDFMDGYGEHYMYDEVYPKGSEYYSEFLGHEVRRKADGIELGQFKKMHPASDFSADGVWGYFDLIFGEHILTYRLGDSQINEWVGRFYTERGPSKFPVNWWKIGSYQVISVVTDRQILDRETRRIHSQCPHSCDTSVNQQHILLAGCTPRETLIEKLMAESEDYIYTDQGRYWANRGPHYTDTDVGRIYYEQPPDPNWMDHGGP